MTTAQIIGILILAIPLTIWAIPLRGHDSLALLLGRTFAYYVMAVIFITTLVVLFVS